MGLFSKKYLSACLIPFIGVLLFIYLQSNYKYIFYNMEMQQLFVWDWQWISHDLFRAGGFAAVFNGFILQFFAIRYMGAFVTSILSISIILMIMNICRKIMDTDRLLPLCMLPVAFLFINMFSYTYTFIDFTAFLIGIFCLWLYSKTFFKTWVHITSGILISLLLFISAGASSLYFTLCALLLDLLSLKNHKWACVIPTLTVFLAGFISVQMAWTATYSKTFFLSSTFLYKPPFRIFIYAGWLSTIVCICIYGLFKQLEYRISHTVEIVLGSSLTV